MAICNFNYFSTARVFENLNIGQNYGAQGFDCFVTIDNEDWKKFQEYPENKITFIDSFGEEVTYRSKKLEPYTCMDDFLIVLNQLDIPYTTYFIDGDTYIDNKNYHVSLLKATKEDKNGSKIKILKSFEDNSSIINNAKSVFFIRGYDSEIFRDYIVYGDIIYFKDNVQCQHLFLTGEITSPVSSTYEIINERLFLNIFFSYEKDNYRIATPINDIIYKNTNWKDIEDFSTLDQCQVTLIINSIFENLKLQ